MSGRRPKVVILVTMVDTVFLNIGVDGDRWMASDYYL